MRQLIIVVKVTDCSFGKQEPHSVLQSAALVIQFYCATAHQLQLSFLLHG